MKNMREQILFVATGLFDSRGIHASGVDTIIAESGIAKSTLYRYFPSKEQLITAYLRDKSDRFYEWINTRLSSKKADSIEILYELCELVEQWISTPNFHGLPFHVASAEFPDPTHPINSFSLELSKDFQNYISRIAELAGVKDPDTLGQQLTIIFEGGAMIERLNPGAGAAKRAKNAAITLIKTAVK